MKFLKAIALGLGAVAVSALGVVGIKQATAVGFADAYVRPISGPSPSPRAGQTFTVWYAVGNKGTANATNVVLTIAPINDPNVQVLHISSIRPCTPVGVSPITCTIGTLGTSGGIIAVGVQYIASVPGSYPTNNLVTSSNDSNASNNFGSTNIIVTP